MVTSYDAIDSHIRRLKHTMYTTLPAVVTEIITEGDDIVFISAKPVNDKRYRNNEYVERKQVRNIPLLFPSSEEGIISFPIKEGDHVVLLFCQEDISNLIFSSQTEGPPNTDRRFDMNDVIAIPSIHTVQSNVRAHKDNFIIKFNDFILSVQPSGETSLETPESIKVTIEGSTEWTTRRFMVETDSLYLGNGNVELLSTLSDLTQAISDITVQGKPIDNKTQFTALKSKLDQLIG